MSEIIDRVAKAIEQASQPPGQKDYKILMENCARAAIEAMRDPSQGMRIAGHAALVSSEACALDLGDQIGFGALGDAWRAMIDDALSRS